MSVDFNTSKTKVNLMQAFAGECQAYIRYSHAEEQAKQQKLFVLADLFRFTADQEKVHAEIFYSHLKDCSGESIEIHGGYPVDISQNVLDLLKMAVNNEQKEHEEVYPYFAQVARDEGFSEIAQDFENIAKIESYHGERFKCFADLMEQDKLFTSEQTETWYCLNCGYILEGTQAPQKCPVCSGEQGYYIRLCMTPWTCEQ